MVHAELAWKRILGNFIDFTAGYVFKFLCLIRVVKVDRTDLSALKPQNILVIRTDSMGDVVMSTPVYRAIKDKYPKAKVFALIRSGFCEVLLDNPNVDQIITHDVPWNKERSGWLTRMKIIFSIETLLYPFRLVRVIRLLRRQKFDLGIDLLGDFRNILFFMVAAGVKRRLSFSRTGGEYFLTDFVEYDIKENQLTNHACLLKKLGINNVDAKLEIFVSQKVKAEVSDMLKAHGVNNGAALVVMHPGAKKIQRWPAENFARLGKRLIEEFNIKLLLTGVGSDLGLKQKMEPILNGAAVSLMGSTNIPQLAALLSQQVLLICNDTGVMHVASAVNCKTLAVFGPTNPGAFAHPNIEVIQPRLPCKLSPHEKCEKKSVFPGACMNETKVDIVYERVRDLLAENVAGKRKDSFNENAIS